MELRQASMKQILRSQNTDEAYLSLEEAYLEFVSVDGALLEFVWLDNSYLKFVSINEAYLEFVSLYEAAMVSVVSGPDLNKYFLRLKN